MEEEDLEEEGERYKSSKSPHGFEMN